MQQNIARNVTANSTKCMMANNNNSVNERMARAESIDKIEKLSETHCFAVIVHSTGKVITGNLIADTFDIVDVETTSDGSSK